MPDRTWSPPHPTTWDRVIHHPIEVSLAHFQMFACFALMFGRFTGAPSASPSMAELPTGFLIWLSSTMGVGGILILVGLVGWPSLTQLIRTYRAQHKIRIFNEFDNLRARWLAERTGLLLSILAWASYGVTVYHRFPGSSLSWGLAIAVVVAFSLRFVATVLIDRAATASVSRLRNGGGVTHE